MINIYMYIKLASKEVLPVQPNTPVGTDIKLLKTLIVDPIVTEITESYLSNRFRFILEFNYG